jgi:uncharacterized protein (DUF305 family)
VPTATTSAVTPTPAGSPGSREQVAAENNEADVMFAQMMIPHHQQAVEMSDVLLAKDDVPSNVRDFAQQVIDAQGPEIDHMEEMLDTWQQPMPESDDSSMEHGSGGMMTDEDMGQLEQAQGTDAARLYLEQMIVHHEGAVDMARDEVSDGQNPQAIALAQDVITAQESEIAQMRTMIEDLPARG